MGSSSECYILKWNGFHESVANSFTDLRKNEEFLDVTLAIDQDHQLSAHKVILSASSPYFHGVLKLNPAQHPVLVMPPNVRYTDLIKVIDFIYRGEVKVPIEDFQEFFSLAQLLKIRGLTEDMEKEGGHDNNDYKDANEKGIENCPRQPSGTQGRRRTGGRPRGGQPLKRPRTMARVNQIPKNTDHDQFEEYLREGNIEIDETVEGTSTQNFPESTPPSNQGSSPGPGIQLTGLLCPNCRLMCDGVDALKEHMSEVHGMGDGLEVNEEEQKQFMCHICDKTFKQAKYVQAHIKRVHKIVDEGEDSTATASMMFESPIKKKGRHPKQPMPEHELQQPDDFEPAPSAGRPIGQVTPAPRGLPHPQQKIARMPPQRGRGGIRRNPITPRPTTSADLKSLGTKLGGQISISSTSPGQSQSQSSPRKTMHAKLSRPPVKPELLEDEYEEGEEYYDEQE